MGHDDDNASKKKPNGRAEQVIDDNLRRVYRDMLDEKVPVRFTQLLAQLRDQDAAGAADADGVAAREEDE